MLVLGDLVGYGADPNAVIDRVRALPGATIIRGNHDKVGSGLETVDSFNHLARHAIAWTATALTPANRLAGGDARRPRADRRGRGDLPRLAVRRGRLHLRRPRRAARRRRRRDRLCLFGHTHVPAVFKFDGGLSSIGPPRGAQHRLTLDPKERKYLINCGAVGQPRDGDPRAAFGVFDTESRTLTIVRVALRRRRGAGEDRRRGLPEVLAQRLAIGR